MWTMLLAVAAFVAFFYGKHKLLIWKQSLPQRRQMAAADRAKAKEEAKRPMTHRLHNVLPDRYIIRLLRWTPDRVRTAGAPRVRIARRGFRGRFEKINPGQHIAAIGMTGSGKSSTLRVLGAWAIRQPGWYLEAWDGKWGASVRPYKSKAVVLDNITEIEARLRDLVDRELPQRATMADPSHLAIIMDESRLLNNLSSEGMTNLVTVIQTGRELGVHLWFGLQDPKADSIPTEIRDQFSCKLVHMLQNQEAATVALKELVVAGWEPHKLMRAGQLLVWEPVRRPRVLLGMWLSTSVLAALPLVGPVADPAFARRVVLTKASVRVPGHAPDLGARFKADGRTDRQTQALTVLSVLGPIKPAQLGRELDVDRNRAHDVLTQLAAKGDAIKHEDGTYALAERQS